MQMRGFFAFGNVVYIGETAMLLTTVNATQILTRTSGYLTSVASHSLQPYRGCALGNSLCGVGCYVQHSWYVTRGQRWGSFVESRMNAAELYAEQFAKEQNWARLHHQRFVIFLSSATEPFQPLSCISRAVWL